MKSAKISLAALIAAVMAAPAMAHDCAGRIAEFDQLIEEASERAISAASGGQAVAGSREAQAITGTGEPTEDPVVPVQDEVEEAIAVEQADDAGNAGEQIIQVRASLDEAREQISAGDEASCTDTLHTLMLDLLKG